MEKVNITFTAGEVSNITMAHCIEFKDVFSKHVNMQYHSRLKITFSVNKNNIITAKMDVTGSTRAANYLRYRMANFEKFWRKNFPIEWLKEKQQLLQQSK